jgi:hypothetical protein
VSTRYDGLASEGVAPQAGRSCEACRLPLPTVVSIRGTHLAAGEFRLGDDAVQHLTVDVGQAALYSIVVVGEFGVVNP